MPAASAIPSRNLTVLAHPGATGPGRREGADPAPRRTAPLRRCCARVSVTRSHREHSSWTRIDTVSERAGRTPSQAAVGAVVGLGLLVGLWQRATPLAGAFLFGDELHSLGALELPWSVLVARYDAVGSGLALPLVQKGLVAGFGASLPVLRTVAFVPSLLLVAVAAGWAHREGGRPVAAVAALLVAMAPVFVFYGHFGRAYSLAALLCVAVPLLCGPPGAQAARGGRPLARSLGVAVLGGFAAFAHLVSVFFLVGLGVGLGVATLAARGMPGLLRHPAFGGLLGAAALALLLHAAAFESLLAFVGAKGEQVYRPGFGPLDVGAVLVGSSTGLAIAAPGLLASAAFVARARGLAAAPLLCAVFLPPLLLWAVAPYGDAYAYARYLLPSAAAACVLLAIGSVRLGELAAARLAGLPVALPGLLLAWGLLLLGPRGPAQPALGPFANTYLGLFALPAFTDVAPPAPDVYAELAGRTPPLTVVEVPPLRNRAVHYLAALWLRHGQELRMGTFGPIVPGAPPLDSDLYVDLTRLAARPRDFDALIVHRRIVDEVERFWVRVYRGETRGSGDALLERHRVYGHDLPSVGGGVIDDLVELLGEPTHEDVDIVMWRFTRPPLSAP